MNHPASTDLDRRIAHADLAAIELIISKTIREANLNSKQSERLVEAQAKCRRLVERCCQCLKIRGADL